MKKLIISMCIVLSMACSGCKSIIEFGQETAWKAEVKYSEKYLDGELAEKLNKEVESENLSRKQADKILEGGTEFLQWAKSRAERKLSERKAQNASK